MINGYNNKDLYKFYVMKLKIQLSMIMLCTSLFAFSQSNKTLNVGDKAPLFTLENATGEKISLKRMLKKGPVILTWYRGAWCPYCNLALVELQNHLGQFKELGAELIAISPQLPDSTLSFQERKELKFTLLSDRNNKIAQKYGITFNLAPEKNKLYEEKIGLSKYNGNTSGTLPIPATYIIDQTGTIRYAYINEDYTKRADPNEILDFLKRLKDQ